MIRASKVEIRTRDDGVVEHRHPRHDGWHPASWIHLPKPKNLNGMRIELDSYECEACGGTHRTYLVLGRDYRYRDFVTYPQTICGSGYGCPYVELESHDCEETRRVERLQVVSRRYLTISEACDIASDSGVKIPDGFFDDVVANNIARHFAILDNMVNV